MKTPLEGCSKNCRKSGAVSRLSEILYFIVGVSPHHIDQRQPLDRFYLFLWVFNLAYMGGLAYAYFIYNALPEWIVGFLAYAVVAAYGGSVLIYTIENIGLKIRMGFNKKRAGHLIVAAWLLLAIVLTGFALFSDAGYNTMLRTIWELSIGTLAALITANRISKIIKEQNGNGNRGGANGAPQ